MAKNHTRKFLLPIDLDDKKRHLSFELRHIEMLEDKYGTLQNAMDAFNNGKVNAYRFFLYVGLLADDKDLTEEYVDSLVNMYNLAYVREQLALALEGNLPPKDDEKK